MSGVFSKFQIGKKFFRESSNPWVTLAIIIIVHVIISTINSVAVLEVRIGTRIKQNNSYTKRRVNKQRTDSISVALAFSYT